MAENTVTVREVRAHLADHINRAGGGSTVTTAEPLADLFAEQDGGAA
ncbi:hypothetical protein [Streptomyces sp. NRRL F-5650]|nr:hypothetical protein [Streptomyces sp. NRRL F-5650]